MLLLIKCIKTGHKHQNKIITRMLVDGTEHTFQKEWDLNMKNSPVYTGCTMADFEVLELPDKQNDDPVAHEVFKEDVDLDKDVKGKVIGYKKLGRPIQSVNAVPVNVVTKQAKIAQIETLLTEIKSMK